MYGMGGTCLEGGDVLRVGVDCVVCEYPLPERPHACPLRLVHSEVAHCDMAARFEHVVRILECSFPVVEVIIGV